MISHNLNNSQSVAHVREVSASVTLRLCQCGCGASLEGRRSDAKTATPACRQRKKRAETIPTTSGKDAWGESLPRSRRHLTLGVVYQPSEIRGGVVALPLSGNRYLSPRLRQFAQEQVTCRRKAGGAF